MLFYSDQGFSEVESSVSLLYNYPVLQSLKYYDSHLPVDMRMYFFLEEPSTVLSEHVMI